MAALKAGDKFPEGVQFLFVMSRDLLRSNMALANLYRDA